jgi:hypothetical protein
MRDDRVGPLDPMPARFVAGAQHRVIGEAVAYRGPGPLLDGGPRGGD